MILRKIFLVALLVSFIGVVIASAILFSGTEEWPQMWLTLIGVGALIGTIVGLGFALDDYR